MSDVAVLDRVMLRLASLPEASLGGVLSALLPQLLKMLTPEMEPSVRGKLLEVLSHISARVRDRPMIPLPFDTLLEALQEAPPLRATFIMVYLRLAFSRLSPAQLDAACPALLAAGAAPTGTTISDQRDALMLMGLRALRNTGVPMEPTERESKFPLLSTPNGATVVSALLLDAMLFQRPLSSKVPSLGASSMSLYDDVVAPGLSPVATARLLGVARPTANVVAEVFATTLRDAGIALSGDEVVARKRDVMRVLAAGLLQPTQCLHVAVCAACDTAHDIVDAGEDYLRQHGPGADLDTPALVAALAALVVGSGAQSDASAVLEARSPAPVAVRCRAIGYLSRSRAVLNAPGATALRVIFAALFGRGTTPKLQLLGVRLATLVFSSAVPTTEAVETSGGVAAPASDAVAAATRALAPFAVMYLQGLLKLLASITGEASVSTGDDHAVAPATASLSNTSLTSATAAARAARAEAARIAASAYRESGERERLREATYSAIGALAARAPAAFQGSLAVAKRLFAALRDEDPSVRLSVAEALSSLATAYETPRRGGGSTPLSVALREELHDLLLLASDTGRSTAAGDGTDSGDEIVGSTDNYRVRLAAIDWASRVFPFSDVRARYLALRLTADRRPEVSRDR